MTSEAEAAFGDLLDELAATQARMVEQLADDPTTLLESHKWILSILQVAAEVNLWADTAWPRFVEIVGPYKKWGGDNADASYRFAPIDPTRTDRIIARPGDAVYLSLTVYGGLNDGRYSERIVGMVNSRHATPGPDGSIRIVASPVPPSEPGVAWIKLEPDAVAALTRDYLEDPATGRQATWHIEADDPPDTFRQNDADLAVPPSGHDDLGARTARMVPPYPVPTTTFGWATGDAAYAMGAFDLADDEALVIRGRSPECVFWNLCLWNPLLHTYNYDYERVTINGAQVVYEPDGSWTVVVSYGAQPTRIGSRPLGTGAGGSGSAGSSPITLPSSPRSRSSRWRPCEWTTAPQV